MAAQPAIREFAVDIPEGMRAPSLARALAEAGDLIRETWTNLANHHSVSGAYIKALESSDAVQYPFQDNVDRVAVINATPQADWLEKGRAGFHLPERWGRGTGKWKVAKDGSRYAIIPFSHTTPIKEGAGSTPQRRRTAMPLEIYNRAKKLEHGERVKLSDTIHIRSRKKVYGTAELGEYGLQSKPYNHFRQVFGEGAVPDHLPEGYTWKSPKFAGLMHESAKTPAGGNHGAYTTLRVMREDSPGWYIPPTPAHRYAERALEQAAPEIQKALDLAASLDATRALNAAISPLD